MCSSDLGDAQNPDGQNDPEGAQGDAPALEITINPDDLESQQQQENPMFIVADPADE